MAATKQYKFVHHGSPWTFDVFFPQNGLAQVVRYEGETANELVAHAALDALSDIVFADSGRIVSQLLPRQPLRQPT